MCEFLAKGKAVCAFLSASIMAVTSCVNERYEISDDNLDLKVTIFQEGLSLPLGSTGKIRMDSIMNKIGLPEDFKQYLSEGADGSYA